MLIDNNVNCLLILFLRI